MNTDVCISILQISKMEERDSKEEVTIIDKDESSERAVSVVSGFVIEESVKPFPVRTIELVFRGRVEVKETVSIKKGCLNKYLQNVGRSNLM